MTPKISVVMPVYNGEKYLKEAIESVLNQTFRDFEFITINDGSTDSTEKVIQTFSDPRIVYIKNAGNLGLSKSFNIGIKAAKGELIARMDADDISLPHRFAVQYEYLERNKKVGILGSAMILIDENGKKGKLAKRPATHRLIKWQSLFSNPIFHPTVMARAEILKNNLFDETLYNSEDYELWSRLIFETDTIFANLKNPLILYRVHLKSFTQKLDPLQKEKPARVAISNIERYLTLKETDKELILRFRREEYLKTSEYLTIWSLVRKTAKKFGASMWECGPVAKGLIKSFIKQHLR